MIRSLFHSFILPYLLFVYSSMTQNLYKRPPNIPQAKKRLFFGGGGGGEGWGWGLGVGGWHKALVVRGGGVGTRPRYLIVYLLGGGGSLALLRCQNACAAK